MFDDIKQIAVTISTGTEMSPVLYRDGSLLVVGYRIEPSHILTVLRNLPFEPLPIFGRVIVLLLVAEYRDTTIGSYNEIGILVSVRRTGTTPSLWRILRDMRRTEDV